MTDETQEGADVKLVDFGLSAHFQDFRLEHDVVGTWVRYVTSMCELAASLAAPTMGQHKVTAATVIGLSTSVFSVRVAYHDSMTGVHGAGGDQRVALPSNVRHVEHRGHRVPASVRVPPVRRQ